MHLLRLTFRFQLSSGKTILSAAFCVKLESVQTRCFFRYAVWCYENAIGYAEHYSRSKDPVIRVYDDAGNVIETHEHAGDFKE